MITVALHKISQSANVDFDALPEASKDFVIRYGLTQVLNDAMASAKFKDRESPTPSEIALARALVDKRLDNITKGVMRASPIREGNPVRKRAIELALAAVKVAPGFAKWLNENKLKPGDKDAVAKARELAVAAADKPDSKFMVQAEKDVKAAKALGEIEIEI